MQKKLVGRTQNCLACNHTFSKHTLFTKAILLLLQLYIFLAVTVYLFSNKHVHLAQSIFNFGNHTRQQFEEYITGHCPIYFRGQLVHHTLLRVFVTFNHDSINFLQMRNPIRFQCFNSHTMATKNFPESPYPFLNG